MAFEVEPDVAFAYLFGSVAKDRARPASDVDVAVWLGGGARDPGAVVDRALELEATLEPRLGKPVQVVVLNTAPLDLAHNVLRHGILVFSRDESVRTGFYVDHARRYYAMAPARAIFARYMARRIREGTFGGGGHYSSSAAGDR